MSKTSKFVPGSAFLQRPTVSQNRLQYFTILSSFRKLLEWGSRVTMHISRHLLGTLFFLQHFCSGERGSKNWRINISLIDLSLKKTKLVRIDVLLISSNDDLSPFLHWSMAFQKPMQYLKRLSPYLLILRLTSPAGTQNSMHSVGTFLVLQHFSSCDRSVEWKKQMLYSYKGVAFPWSPHFDFH